jgi:cell wall-associated NlpC family hydrolase
MIRPLLLLAVLIALLVGCASNPEPMRTGITTSSRYHTPDPTRPITNPSNPAIVGEAAWQSEATKWIGVPFRTGGNSREGMDTLGLVRKMYENVARIQITSGLEELSRTGVAIPRDQIRPGDIIFFERETGRRIDPNDEHYIKLKTDAGIYLGKNRFVQASPTFGVAYAQLNDPQFSHNYRTARRILR